MANETETFHVRTRDGHYALTGVDLGPNSHTLTIPLPPEAILLQDRLLRESEPDFGKLKGGLRVPSQNFFVFSANVVETLS